MKKHAGDKAIFAIEYDLYLVTQNQYFGDIWFWVNGEKIGAEEADTYLYSCAPKLKKFMQFKEIRRYSGSAEKSGAEMFNILCEKSFDGSDKTRDEYLKLSIYSTIFWLTEVGDANFRDEVKIIMIDEPEKGRQRLIWKKYSDKVLKEYFIAYGLFEEVSLAFIKEIENDVVNWKPAE